MLSKGKNKIIALLIAIVSILSIILFVKIMITKNYNQETLQAHTNAHEIVEDDIAEESSTNNIIYDKLGKNFKHIETAQFNKENCEYTKNPELETIVISEYDGTEDYIIIPTEIDNKKVEKIEKDAFVYSLNLETIKIPVEIADAVTEIKYFEINEENSDEDYVEYRTTREYSEEYVLYMTQTEEEKEIFEIIPEKFNVPLEEVYSENMQELYDVSDTEVASSDSSFDLRNYIDIGVENQGSHGTCYAYAALTSVETIIALTRKEIVDFSEIHAGVLSKAGYGGNFNYVKNYFNTDYGPVYEEDWSKNNLYNNTTLENATIIDNYLKAEGSITSAVIAEMRKTKQVESEFESNYLPSITYADKHDESKKEMVALNRAAIKKHIQEF